MADQDFYIKAHDTAPTLDATLKDAAGNPENLENASVRFHMRKQGESGSPKVDAAATVLDASAGTVRYSWTAADTNVPGIYLGEFEVAYQDGSVQTYPNKDLMRVHVMDDIG